MADSEPSCSFCGKSQRYVQLLIAGPDAHICDECVDVCVTVLAERDAQDLPPQQVTTPLGVVATCSVCELPMPVEEALLIREHGRICPACAGEVVAALERRGARGLSSPA